ncbi:MAG: hypothetical protein GY869_21575, partial [Planctomycetes bacterium]|nr:hypothetical protein [Planctomycetota bacterium]
ADAQIALNNAPEQLRVAALIGKAFSEIDDDRITSKFTAGHSLGGGEAQAAGVAGGLKVVTFESPGVRNEIEQLVANGTIVLPEGTTLDSYIHERSIINISKDASLVSGSPLTSDHLGRQVELPLSFMEKVQLGATTVLGAIFGGPGGAAFGWFVGNATVVHGIGDIQMMGIPVFGDDIGDVRFD